MFIHTKDGITYDSLQLKGEALELMNKFNNWIDYEYRKNNDYTEMERLFRDLEWGEGCYGITYRLTNETILKRFFSESQFESGILFDNDASILSNLFGIPCYPKLIASKPYEFMITEFIEGDLLHNVISNGNLKSIPYKKWLDFIYNIVETLDYGYLPQDLHSGNIIVDKDYNLKIIDVGAFISYEKGEFINVPKVFRESALKFLKPLYYSILEDELKFAIDEGMPEIVDSDFEFDELEEDFDYDNSEYEIEYL